MEEWKQTFPLFNVVYVYLQEVQRAAEHLI